MSDHDTAMAAEERRLWLARWVFSPLAGVTWSGWGRILREHGGSIPPQYWARTAFTSMMATLNSGIVGHERKTYRAEIEAMRVERPVFILGHHRSGTTHLWNLLSKDPRFASPSVLQAVFPQTFLTFEKFARGGAERLAPRKRPQDNVKFSADEPIEEERALCSETFLSIQMGRHFPQKRDTFKTLLGLRDASPEERDTWKASLDRFGRKLMIRHGAEKILLFKAPDHTAKVALIRELYPDARFIHIHRDPYTVFQSTVKMEKTTVPLYAYQKPDEDTLTDFILWRYRAMYDSFFADQPDIPEGQFAEVSFTELEANPLGSLERIYQTLDLGDFETAKPDIEAYAQSIAGYQKNTYTNLPDDLKARVAEAWSENFERWGYAK
ncbi:MAG: sulfotransferase [Pseudomonadota bacterium]